MNNPHTKAANDLPHQPDQCKHQRVRVVEKCDWRGCERGVCKDCGVEVMAGTRWRGYFPTVWRRVEEVAITEAVLLTKTHRVAQNPEIPRNTTPQAPDK